MHAVNFAELNELAGELLPERTVLSTITTPFNNWNPGSNGGTDGAAGGSSSSSAAASGGGNGGGRVGVVGGQDHGSQSVSACNTNNTPQGNNGLLGLFQTPAQNTQACQPAAVTGSF
ncbi:MAG: hypothetical protein J2P26_02995 [Nocardiopsaceae bacterium]|nr:hypothetical protein [Nocardiopsaceae bacterium]